MTWAVRNHPWVDEVEGADVRVAMTVLSRESAGARLVEVNDLGNVTNETLALRLNSDLSAHANVPAAAKAPLLANAGISAQAFKLVGEGFVVSAEEAQLLLKSDPRHAEVLKPYLNGRDLTSKPRGVYVIDFGLRDEIEARSYPLLYDIVRTRVKPERDANKRASRAKNWWRFGEPNPNLRRMLAGLARYLVTPEVSKHRFFAFLPGSVAPDGKLVCVASDDVYVLGLVSCTIHAEWSVAAGGRHGVGNDPVYSKTMCFEPFPFPFPVLALRSEIDSKATALDAHRKSALARDPRVTMTGMYNVVEKLRSGAPLTPKERTIHELAACGVLKDLHDELDALVAQAYGWPWPMQKEEILERLVALHDERVAEEQAGRVRWLRPDYQIPRFGKDLPAGGELALPATTRSPAHAAPVAPAPWPKTAIEQLAAVKALFATRVLGTAEVVAAFTGADPKLVARHIETLALMGELVPAAEGRYSLGTSSPGAAGAAA